MSRRGAIAGAAAAVVAAAGRGAARAQEALLRPGFADGLIVVDVQNCFMPGGSLAVPRGDEVVPVINAVAKAFRIVVLTQDWHTPGHSSFASAHVGKKPFDVVRMSYGNQVQRQMCIRDRTQGAELHGGLDVPQAQLVLRKGYNPKVDSYSAFLEADRRTKTGLEAWLKAKGVTRVFCCGLATDFCVAWTALDARKLGFEAVVIEDACRAIDLDGSLDKAWAAMAKAGVERVQASMVRA